MACSEGNDFWNLIYALGSRFLPGLYPELMLIMNNRKTQEITFGSCH